MSLGGTILSDLKREHVIEMIQHGLLSAAEWNDMRARTVKVIPSYFTTLYDLSYTDFSDLNLSGFNFDRCDLSFCNFSSTNLKGISLRQARISVSLFEEADLSDSHWHLTSALRSVFEHCNLDRAHIERVSFYQATFCRASFRDAQLLGNDFDRCVLDSVTFNRKTKLTHSSFLGASILRTDVMAADLSDIYRDLEYVLTHMEVKEYQKLKEGIKRGKVSKKALPDSDRASIRFMKSLTEGDTPENSAIAATVLTMVEAYQLEHGRSLRYILTRLFGRRRVNPFVVPATFDFSLYSDETIR